MLKESRLACKGGFPVHTADSADNKHDKQITYIYKDLLFKM